MKTRLLTALAAVALLSAAGPALSGAAGVAGQKLDSGLGDLPHYSQWLDKSGRHPVGVHIVGESLDSGLGELPHYSRWADPTGKAPAGRMALLGPATR